MYEIESNSIDIKDFFGELALKGNLTKAKSFYLIMDHCTHMFRLFVFQRREKYILQNFICEMNSNVIIMEK